MGRRQGKTFLVALLVVACLIGPCAPPANGTIVSAALTRDQASHVFRFAKKIIEANQILADRVKIRDSLKELEVISTGVLYKAISADAKAQLGRSLDVIILDEVGQWGVESDLQNTLETSCSSAVNPLSLYISTIGPNDDDLFNKMIDDAISHPDERNVVHYHHIPDELDAFDEQNWHLSMPALGHYCSVEEIRELAEQSKRSPSRRNAFLNLMANRRVGAGAGFIDSLSWSACGKKKFTEEDLEGLPCIGGLDLSKRTDITALVYVFEVDDELLVLPRFFMPRQGIEDRVKMDRANYIVWNERGLLTLTDGPVVDYNDVVLQILADQKKFDIQTIAYDPWNFDHIKARADMHELVCDWTPVRQGFKDINPCVVETESAILKGELQHGGNPILTWMASNTVTVQDPAGNRKFDKKKSTHRIDGIVAMSMAVAQIRKRQQNQLNDIFFL